MSLSKDVALTDLQLTLSQFKPASPPTLIITLKNTNAAMPITVLTWNSPLDALLVQLGLITITPPGSTTPLDIPTIMVKRRMPPPEDSLVTLGPGEEVSRTVEIGERFVTPERWRGDGSGGPAKVQLKGRWTAVWPGVKKQDLVGTKTLETLGYGGEEGVLSGEYESEILEIDL
ncbi:hypothetical protein BR93DRAFT_930896 [Coniochaeta sp. PMI_546]|nr:hypothetical protein BR93DRAFT_930896 [Coniochaeta sp. PMI_546]